MNSYRTEIVDVFKMCLTKLCEFSDVQLVIYSVLVNALLSVLWRDNCEMSLRSNAAACKRFSNFRCAAEGRAVQV